MTMNLNEQNNNGHVNVLILIDFEGTRKVVKKFITLMNSKTHLFEAANIATAVKISSNEQIDVVVADEKTFSSISDDRNICEINDPNVKVLVLSSHTERTKKLCKSNENLHVFDKVHEIEEFYNLLSKLVVISRK